MLNYCQYNNIMDLICEDRETSLQRGTIIGKVANYDLIKNNHLLDVRDGEDASRIKDVTDKKIIDIVSAAYAKNNRFNNGTTHILHKLNDDHIIDLVIYSDFKDKTINVKTAIIKQSSNFSDYFTKSKDNKSIIVECEEIYIVFI